MNPNEFIVLSARIVSFGEAGARSAVSRAYYGAFHCALECLVRLQTSANANGASHAVVPQFFQSATHNSAIEAGHLLSDLHSDRVKADYQLSNSKCDARGFAKSCIESANAIVDRINLFEQACKNDGKLLTTFRESVAKVKAIRGLK